MNKIIKYLGVLKKHVPFCIKYNLRHLLEAVKSYFVIPIGIKCKWRTANINSILVVMVDKMGDFVICVPALRAIRRKYANSKLAILVTPGNNENARLCPYINVVYNCNFNEKGLPVLPDDLIGQFDLALDFRDDASTTPLVYMSKAPYRVGFAVPPNGYLYTRKIKKLQGKFHLVERPLAVAQSIGCQIINKELEWWIPGKALIEAQNLLTKLHLDKGNKVILIHPGASTKIRMWPAEHYATLAAHLANDGYNILVSASKEEYQLAETVKNGNPNITNLAGKSPVSILAALLKSCDAIITQDTGPMHLAMAVGTPVVDIHSGVLPPWYSGPYGDTPHRIVESKVDCSYCYYGCKDRKCLYRITPEEVYKKLKELLA